MKLKLASLVVSTLLMATASHALAEDFGDSDFSETAASVFKVDDNNKYSDNLALREARKVGVGANIGGTLGMYGLNVEINFEDENGALVGLGGGEGYRSFHFMWKHVFLGDTVAPYTTLGYSRWYNSTGESANHSSILDRVLTDDQKNNGHFATDFLAGSVGLQFTQLHGYMAGTSLFAELVLLEDIHDNELVPTGAVGALYYF